MDSDTRHPHWCIGHKNGVHRSRPVATARPGVLPVDVSASLWAFGTLTGVQLDLTYERQRHSYLLDLGQARVLRHVLGRLIDLTGPDPANRGAWTFVRQ